VLPFFHVFAMTVAMNAALGWGAEIVMLPRYEHRSLMGAIRRRARPSSRRADAVQGDARQGRDAGAARLHPQLHLGGAPLPLEVKRAFEAASGCTLVEGYGLTEASPVCFCNPLQAENRAGTIGLPLPGWRRRSAPGRPVPCACRSVSAGSSACAGPT
jgi:long-chain acyl-CoA synthetase